jgi:hypothetical protein
MSSILRDELSDILLYTYVTLPSSVEVVNKSTFAGFLQLLVRGSTVGANIIANCSCEKTGLLIDDCETAAIGLKIILENVDSVQSNLSFVIIEPL